MNLTQFRTELAALLSLNVDDADELALMDQWINEGVTYVVGETGSKVTVATADVTAALGDYNLDTDILRILWIETGGAQLEPAGPTEILRRRLNAATTDAPQLYAVDGANLLMLYPTPSEDGTLTVYHVPRPTTLADGADIPTEIPAEFHRLVVLYAAWRGGDYDDDQTSAQGSRYKQLLDEGIKQMKSRLMRKRGRRLPRATVSRRRGVPHRNDTDWG